MKKSRPTYFDENYRLEKTTLLTVKSFSGALLLATTNPNYDKRFFIDLPVQYMKTTSSEHVVYINCFCFDIQNNLCTQHVLSLLFSCTELVIQ